MADKHLMVPAGFGQGKVSTLLANVPKEDLGAGIRSGFGIIGYKGKVWSTKFQGDEKPLMREDGDGARASIEVVIVKASQSIAKIFYEAGYVEGSVAPPDCWSTTGITPDSASPKKQSTTCAGCPKNAWGSKVTEAGKQTKACADSKRLAITPLADMKNEAMGGPMLLRVPAASLKDLKSYGDELQRYGYPYFAVATRISFDVADAFPKFVFTAMRPLSDEEAKVVIEMRDGSQVNSILNESVEVVHHEPAAAVVPASPFENKNTAQGTQDPKSTVVATQQPATPASTTPTTPAPAQAATGAKEPRKRRTKAEMEAAAAALKAQREGGVPPAAVAQPTQAATPATEVPAPEDFDKLLDALLPT